MCVGSINMRACPLNILQLCLVVPVVFVGLAVTQKEISPLPDYDAAHLVSDDAEKSEFPTLEISGNSNTHVPQTSGIAGKVKDVCERGCVENDTTTSFGESQGDPSARIHPDPTVEYPFQGGIAISSQQAVELLVSSWNDLSKWAPRTDTSSVCEQHVERAIKGFLYNEMWALRIFDSWAKPGPSLLDGRTLFSGNYYQCREAVDDDVATDVGFRGNYCVVTFSNLTNARNEHHQLFLHIALSTVQLGTCMPDSCSQADITEMFQGRLQALNATHFLEAVSTDCRNDEREYTTFTVVAILLVLVIGTLTIAGTVVDIALNQIPQWMNSPESEKDPKDDTVKSPGTVKDGQASQGRTTQGVWVKVLISFSAYSNGRRLLSTSQPPGSISVIPGLRFINMSWIVVGHTFFILIFGQSNNIAEGLSRISRYRIFDLINSMHFGVDSFFTISGFLVSYLTVQHVIKKGWGFDWKHFFLHRYWRLTPTLMVAFVLIQGLQRFAVYGTVAPTLQPLDKLTCEDHWWHIPLYLSNFLKVGLDEGCFGHAWSLSADFQFYLLSPLMMIPFYYNKVAGLLSCLFFIVGQWIVAGIFNYHTNGQIGMLGFTADWFKYCYCPFYSRIAPFTVGILTGYILSANNGRVKMSAPTVAIGWVVATTAGLFLIFGFHDDLSRESPSSLLVATVYNTLSRTVWGAVLSWVVVACTSGYGGPVTAFLSWSPFVVLGRLTYMGYLVQMSVTSIIFENLEQLTSLNLSNLIAFGAADLIFTCLVSAVLVMCVEFPTLNLERVLRDKK